MYGLLQTGPFCIASRRMVCQLVALLMRDVKNDGSTFRMPGDEMNASHKKWGVSVRFIDY